MLDVAIIGGGAAGLWLLDDLMCRGYRALLLEAGDLGSGQTIGSQGIIHGGLKYTLAGRLDPRARAIREMPGRWQRALAGVEPPDLRRTRVRAPCCHLWRTGTIASRAAMIGARAGLRVRPVLLDRGERPAVLEQCPGSVARLDEQVIDPASLLADLAGRHRGSRRIVAIDAERGLDLAAQDGRVVSIGLRPPGGGDRSVEIPVAQVVLTAGSGNGPLRTRLGLDPGSMQLRPLHMVLVRGELPVLNGHCVDGLSTRVTITTAAIDEASGRTVWQVGGQVAEDGVGMDDRSLLAHARRELEAVLPGLDLSGAQWATYRAARAEGSGSRFRLPKTAPGAADVSVLHEGNVITAWPTKLALVPRLADCISQVIERLGPPERDRPGLVAGERLEGWPEPAVALPPWETTNSWIAGL